MYPRCPWGRENVDHDKKIEILGRWSSSDDVVVLLMHILTKRWSDKRKETSFCPRWKESRQWMYCHQTCMYCRSQTFLIAHVEWWRACLFLDPGGIVDARKLHNAQKWVLILSHVSTFDPVRHQRYPQRPMYTVKIHHAPKETANLQDPGTTHLVVSRTPTPFPI